MFRDPATLGDLVNQGTGLINSFLFLGLCTTLIGCVGQPNDGFIKSKVVLKRFLKMIG
jgi:hypothetical protein